MEVPGFLIFGWGLVTFIMLMIIIALASDASQLRDRAFYLKGRLDVIEGISRSEEENDETEEN